MRPSVYLAPKVVGLRQKWLRVASAAARREPRAVMRRGGWKWWRWTGFSGRLERRERVRVAGSRLHITRIPVDKDCLERFGHARVEDDAFLLEPETACGHFPNPGRGEAKIEVRWPCGL